MNEVTNGETDEDDNWDWEWEGCEYEFAMEDIE
jgi:hypothetical protein